MTAAEAGQNGWSTLESTLLCDEAHAMVYRENVATPSRPGGVTWTIVRRRQAAVIAPQLENGSFVLVHQERVAVRKELWEFPAGQVDGAVTGESIRAAARRELGEEAGIALREELIALGYFYPSVGFTDECCHLFLAQNAVITGMAKPDPSEAILEVRAFSASDLRSMIAEGRIVDANTLALYARLCASNLIDCG